MKSSRGDVTVPCGDVVPPVIMRLSKSIQQTCIQDSRVFQKGHLHAKGHARLLRSLRLSHAGAIVVRFAPTRARPILARLDCGPSAIDDQGGSGYIA